jgi:DNA-binding transcriptional ArsR family regulator
MPFDPPLEVSDPKAMRALAHPVRLALIEALADAGTLTATEAGERVGESPANASFHLRQLAKYGFVEEAGGGTGRQRPWKLKQLGMRFTDVHDDEAAAAAGRQLERVVRDRYLARAARAFEERHALPKAWREVTGGSQFRFYLTPDELREADDAIRDLLLERFGDRRDGSLPHPHGARRVEILTFGYVQPEP